MWETAGPPSQSDGRVNMLEWIDFHCLDDSAQLLKTSISVKLTR